MTIWGRKDEPKPAGRTESFATSQPNSAGTTELSNSVPVPADAGATGWGSSEPSWPDGTRIGKSLRVKGVITGSEDIYIDGDVEGTIALKENCLTLGPNGKVQAEITARSVTVLGHVKGNLSTTDKTEIHKTGSFEGSLVAACIAIEDGAMFRGTIDVVKPVDKQRNSPSQQESCRPTRTDSAEEPIATDPRSQTANLPALEQQI